MGDGVDVDPGACTERELTAPVRLCRDDGSLDGDAVGWSRQPVHDCHLPRGWGRRKRWDYWCVTGPGCALALTYADVDYLGLADVWFADFDAGKTFHASVATPASAGFSMPDRAGAASMRITKRRFALEIREERGGTRLVAAASGRGRELECDVLVERPDGHETLSVVIPWSDRRFQCTTKENTRPATGTVRVSGTEHRLAPGEAWGCLDFGRGIWPYRTTWNWGSASGRQGASVVGLQLGGKWTAGTGLTENALCVDGTLSKLSEELVWDYDPGDWLRPWRIRTPRSARVDLTFTPIHDKRSRLEAGFASTRVHQCFGTYAGSVVPDSGRPLEVGDLFGWAEEARWRW